MSAVLAMDIGGTNTRFGHFQIGIGQHPQLVESLWISSKTTSFAVILRQLAEQGFSLLPEQADRVVIAVAGAVERGVFAKVTNATWAVDLGDPTLAGFARRTTLVNDFVAQAYGCLSEPARESTHVLQTGQADISSPYAVIGAGTGLGMCTLVPLPGGGGHLAIASEGGHAPLAWITGEERNFQEFLVRHTGQAQAIGDAVLSGAGLTLLHWFLTGRRLEPAEVAEEAGPDSETAAWFARLYGRAARTLVLYVLPRAGLFLCGGLAARNPYLVTHPAFLQEFVSAPAYEHLLAGIPITLIRSQDIGLYGAVLAVMSSGGRNV